MVCLAAHVELSICSTADAVVQTDSTSATKCVYLLRNLHNYNKAYF